MGYRLKAEKEGEREGKEGKRTGGREDERRVREEGADVLLLGIEARVYDHLIFFVDVSVAVLGSAFWGSEWAWPLL